MSVFMEKIRIFLTVLVMAGFVLSLPAASSWEPVPDDTLFPAPLADPDYPRFILSFPMYPVQRIDTLEADGIISFREILKVGGVQSLFRFSPSAENPFAFEISIGAGLVTLFDTFEDNLDNFGWEGSGFLTLDFRLLEKMSARFGFHHLSSHVGDEYLARYGVITFPAADGTDLLEGETYAMDYVRDSLVGGLSLYLGQYARLYADARYSMDMLRYMHLYNSYPWQADIGLEFQWPVRLRESSRWYAALHISAYQETSWFPSATVQFGRVLSLPGSNRQFRFGLEGYYGRVQIADFNHTDAPVPDSWSDLQVESYFALGMWYDM